MNIRLGTQTDIDELEKLYDDINDYLEATTNYPGWKKGIYPAREDAENGVKEGCLYVAVEDNEILGSIILRHKPEEAYRSVTWQKELEDSEIFVIYTFAVKANKLKLGIGKKLLAFAEELGKKEGMKALRLDVTQQNTPAIHLYESCGFQFIDTVSLGLEEFGLDWFDLYEKLI